MEQKLAKKEFFISLYSKYVLSDLNVSLSQLDRSSSSCTLKLFLVFVLSSSEHHMGGVFCMYTFTAYGAPMWNSPEVKFNADG